MCVLKGLHYLSSNEIIIKFFECLCARAITHSGQEKRVSWKGSILHTTFGYHFALVIKSDLTDKPNKLCQKREKHTKIMNTTITELRFSFFRLMDSYMCSAIRIHNTENNFILFNGKIIRKFLNPYVHSSSILLPHWELFFSFQAYENGTQYKRKWTTIRKHNESFLLLFFLLLSCTKLCVCVSFFLSFCLLILCACLLTTETNFRKWQALHNRKR